MASMKKRAYLLTFNNPAEHGMTHEAIKEILAKKFKLRYYCMADEIGLETTTLHTHLYLYAVNQIRFITLHKAFPSAHIDQCFGLPSENYAYVTKSGKYAAEFGGTRHAKNAYDQKRQLSAEPPLPRCKSVPRRRAVANGPQCADHRSKQVYPLRKVFDVLP